MICKNCQQQHDGNYASGTFCSKHCSKSYSTKENRSEISMKVSLALRGRPAPLRKGGYKFTKEARLRGLITKAIKRQQRFTTMQFHELPKKERVARIKLECQNCALCGALPIHNLMPLVFHLDHIDGNPKNNLRVNLRLICPNCHSQTPTYAGRNKGRKLKEALRTGDRDIILQCAKEKALQQIMSN